MNSQLFPCLTICIQWLLVLFYLFDSAFFTSALEYMHVKSNVDIFIFLIYTFLWKKCSLPFSSVPCMSISYRTQIFMLIYIAIATVKEMSIPPWIIKGNNTVTQKKINVIHTFCFLLRQIAYINFKTQSYTH